MALFDALRALRDADDSSAPGLGWAWRTVSEHLDRRLRRPEREHADVRQRTLLKIWRGLERLEADTQAAAEAWLRSVHRSAVAEHHRSAGTRMMDRALRATPIGDGGDFLEQRAKTAPEDGEPPPDARAAELDAVLDLVLERVAAWLEVEVRKPAKRQGDYLRAQAALLANVRGLDATAIAEALGAELGRQAMYKWVERGREEVLLPALAGWEHPAAPAVREHLVGSRRADHGKARPARRGRAVSPRAGPASSSKKPRQRKRRNT
jgi:DNA-directed RNA polymerase specialized sigma24 family protein